MAALDTNSDGVISADEIANATGGVEETLDKNGDGKLTRDELRPPRPLQDGGPESGDDKPSESGNKVDVRWMALTNHAGAGVLAVGLPLLSVNASHHTTDDLQNAKHPFQLPARETVTLNLDWQQQGVGGDTSWGAWPHNEYLIPCAEYNYRFRLQPLVSGDDPGVMARAR
ncbi:MAG: hypothetical protein WDN00_16485 [Limisphaerales bacterium]